MSKDLSSIRRRLLTWFDRNRRDLPWRADRDPYRIWISEIMLQQTTVAAVAPRFERFLNSFPTLGDLAAADALRDMRVWRIECP
jgi:A/G-specific adenine glycosylase